MSRVAAASIETQESLGPLSPPGSTELSIRALCELHNNDYSSYEPFTDSSPINTSIIIPIYNGAALFAKCLDHLCAHPEIQARPESFELVIVNDGSTEDVGSIVMSANPACRLKYIELPENGGIGPARNAGLSTASGELITFIDSDVLLPNGFFSEQWRIHNAVPAAVTVALAENLLPDDPKLLRAFSDYSLKPDITSDFRFVNSSIYRFLPLKEELRFTEESNWFKHFERCSRGGTWKLADMVVGHNMTLRRDSALSVNGFDARFVSYGSEDTFFGAKLIASGHFVVPLRENGLFRARHEPRHGDELAQLSKSLGAAVRCHEFQDEPLNWHLINRES